MEKNIKYKVFTLRLGENTKDLLKKKKLKSGLSWNLFIYKLLEYERNPR